MTVRPVREAGTIPSGREAGLAGLERTMDKYVARQNIDHLRGMLATETDEAKRKVLADILAGEEAKLALLLARAKERPKAS